LRDLLQKNMKTNSREKILEKSAKLFGEFGFFGTSMGKIAQSLHITKAALYYYFKSKKELYLEVLKRTSQKLINSLKNLETLGSEKALSEAIKKYLEWGTKERNLIKAQTLQFPKSELKMRTNIQKLRRTIEKQFEEIFKDFLTKEIDLKIFIPFLLGMMDRMILEAAFLRKKLNIKQKTSQILKILNPILKVATK